MNISIIWAQAKHGVIGHNNLIPWYLPQDLIWFQKNTIYKPVIMGRKTFESIGKPLRNRINVILSKNKKINKNFDKCQFSNDPKKALHFVRKHKEIMIIGGKQIYEIFLPQANTLYITDINALVFGNVFFPHYDKKQWNLVFEEYFLRDYWNLYDICFKIFKRKNKV